MKMILSALVLATLSTSAMADSWRSVATEDLVCEGNAPGKSAVQLQIAARPQLTILSLKNGGQSNKILNNADLVVGSEGSVYIQQVSNDLGYNLYLGGKDLWDVLNSKNLPKKVKLSGSLDLFNDNVKYALECEGTLE